MGKRAISPTYHLNVPPNSPFAAQKLLLFLRATNGESRYGTESKISLFLSSDSHWIPVCELRLQILLFSRRNSNGIRCGDRVKNFTFFSNVKSVDAIIVKFIFTFFQWRKTSKNRLFQGEKPKIFRPQKSPKKRPFWTKTGVLCVPRDPKIGFSRAIRP